MFESSVYSDYIYISRYSRYLDKESRRETWPETVARYFDFFQKFLKENNNFELTDEDRQELEQAILSHEIMPSMRALMTAGKALERDSICGYNCAYFPVDSFKAFDELMYIAMCGAGVGYSVENVYVKQLPEMPDVFYETDTTVVFDDSRIGWAKGLREFVSLLALGRIPKYDVSKLRPKGARLKITGGRSSGPDPLVELLDFLIVLFQKAAGRHLSSIEVHDIMCKIGDIVVVGGVRRSAFISLSDLEDSRMRDAKSGNWWQTSPHRRLSNNSAVYNEMPDIGTFMKEWISLYQSKSGERGIFNRTAVETVINNANEFRKTLGIDDIRYRELYEYFGCNPCSEILLRPNEFCNLTSVQIYADDTPETLKRKIRLATILGTMQSCLTNFRYVNKKWQRNCEDERLLGVSLNGIFDNKYTNGRHWKNYVDGNVLFGSFLEDLKIEAINVNLKWAKKIGINSSVAITAIKPEGTTSQLCGTSPGINPNPAQTNYYIRYVRNDLKDPLVPFMVDHGFPFEKDAYDPTNVLCFKFPCKVSPDSLLNVSAIEHLELWKIYQKHYTEHKPSCTINVKESDWLDVGAWVYKNFEWVSGVAFLPAEEGNRVYKQAPYTKCSKEEYEKLLAAMPKEVDWKELSEYEHEDTTTNAMEAACSAGGCSV